VLLTAEGYEPVRQQADLSQLQSAICVLEEMGISLAMEPGEEGGERCLGQVMGRDAFQQCCRGFDPKPTQCHRPDQRMG